MTWLWDPDDMELRVAFARSCSPTDLFTLIARLVVRRIATLLTFVLWPIDQAARVVGHGLIAVVLGFLVLIILTLVWFPIWGMLVGTSWLWFRYPLSRPFLLLPGIILAVVAAVYIILVPDPHKGKRYTDMAGEWPLTWQIWSPPLAYYGESEA